MKKLLLLVSVLSVFAGCASLPDASGCTTDWDCAHYVGYEDLEYQEAAKWEKQNFKKYKKDMRAGCFGANIKKM